MDSERLQQFENEVARLRVKGGDPEPERRLVIGGVVSMVTGLGLLVFAVLGTRAAETVEAQNDYLVLTPIGLALAVVGSVVWARNSMTRYLRFWLLRLIFESRTAPEQSVEAVDGPTLDRS